MWRSLSCFVVALLAMPGALVANPADTASAAQAAVTTEVFLRRTVGMLKFELASSQLALRKTKADVVQEFARRLSLDYSAAGLKFRQALGEAKLRHPRDVLDEVHKALSDELTRTPPGKVFAKTFIEVQLRGLHDDLGIFEAYARSGDDERMKFFAQELVPVLRRHLEQAERLRR